MIIGAANGDNIGGRCNAKLLDGGAARAGLEVLAGLLSECVRLRG